MLTPKRPPEVKRREYTSDDWVASDTARLHVAIDRSSREWRQAATDQIEKVAAVLETTRDAANAAVGELGHKASKEQVVALDGDIKAIKVHLLYVKVAFGMVWAVTLAVFGAALAHVWK